MISTRALALVFLLISLTGCSLLIETRDKQCEVNADCAGFTDAVCDAAGGVCVPASAGCAGPDGCFSCAPEKPEEFLNACTDVDCIPYDNAQLEGLLEEDGSLPAVP